MSVQLNDREFRAYLERIVNADSDTAKEQAADALIVELHAREALELWGRHLASHFGRPQDWEDFTSVITEALLVHVRALTADDLLKVLTVGSYLYFRGKAAVQKWLDSPAVTLAAEMSGMSRRHRMARAAVREMRGKLGREPEPREVVEYVNSRAMLSRKDAVKQGALITVDDVEGALLRAYSMDYTGPDAESNDAFGTPDGGGVTARAEVSLTVAQLGQQAVSMFGPEEGAEVKRTLGLWVNLVLAKEPVTAVAVSDHFGISRRTASAQLKRVDEVMIAFRAAHVEQ